MTIGICYEKNARFSGGAYNSVVSKCEAFSTEPIKKSLPLREEHADKLLELDVAVTAAVARLKEAGLDERLPEADRRRARQPAAVREARQGSRARPTSTRRSTR